MNTATRRGARRAAEEDTMTAQASQDTECPTPSVELLRDRWGGAKHELIDGDEALTKRYMRLVRALNGFYEAVAREDVHATHDFPIGVYGAEREGIRGDLGGHIVEECVEAARDLMIRRIDELGLAR
jgi:hypothetical protein